MILVIGATGKVGFEVCKKLSDRDRSTRAMIRRTSDRLRIQQLREMGISTVEGDLREPSSYNRVLVDITTIIITASSMPVSYTPHENNIENVDLEGMLNFIDHAREMGVKRCVYISLSGNVNLNFPLRNAKREVEEHLHRIEMIYTILRPSFFMETWLSPAAGFDLNHGHAQIFGDGKQRINYISYKDVANFVVESLTNPFARNAIMEIGGPQPVSQLEAIKIFEKNTGRKFTLEYLNEEVLTAQFHQANDPMQKSLIGLQLCLAQGDEVDMYDTLQKFMERLHSVDDYAKHLVAVA